ncbi:MAG: lipoyl synthase, partial [Eubacteriales bacterium]
PKGSIMKEMQVRLENSSLHTVCENSRCPNIGECFGSGTATFLILGTVCTRNCRFCAIQTGLPAPVDPGEPVRAAQVVKALNLKHVVITSVTRDDLPDYGSGHFAATIKAIHAISPSASVEVLIPDFMGDIEALKKLLVAQPQVLGHNMETIPGLYSTVRPQADYRRSLELLRQAKEIAPQVLTKSGLMLGLGEQEEEVCRVILDLNEVSCDIFTLGQYLRPSHQHLPVKEFIHPNKFDWYKEFAVSRGIPKVQAGPFVRSSYHAEELIN